MNESYQVLPLVDLNAPKSLKQSKIRTNTSKEAITQNLNDAETVLKLAGLDVNSATKIVDVGEKYMIETQTDNTTNNSSKSINTAIGIGKEGLRKPHYTRLLVFDKKMVFQAACCLPLKVIAASLDGNTVSGKALFNNHSEKDGGKLAYELLGTGPELIIDVKRGERPRVQRLIFRGDVN